MIGSIMLVRAATADVDLVVVEVGDLVEHLVHGAGGLARRRSSGPPWGKTLVSAQRAGDVLALGDAAPHRRGWPRSTGLVSRPTWRRSSSASRMGTPEESMVPSVRVKRATGDLADERPDDRQLEDEGVPLAAPALGGRTAGAARRPNRRDRDPKTQVPVARHGSGRGR